MRRRTLLGLVALASLAACGRRGPPRLPDAPKEEEQPPPAEPAPETETGKGMSG